jgi:hypothetical protein
LIYHRWGSLSSYQRTRGALQFLARVVHALWKWVLRLLRKLSDVSTERRCFMMVDEQFEKEKAL